MSKTRCLTLAGRHPGQSGTDHAAGHHASAGHRWRHSRDWRRHPDPEHAGRVAGAFARGYPVPWQPVQASYGDYFKPRTDFLHHSAHHSDISAKLKRAKPPAFSENLPRARRLRFLERCCQLPASSCQWRNSELPPLLTGNRQPATGLATLFAMDHAGRLSRLRAGLEEDDLDLFLVTHLPNVHYLCGFTGSAAALLVSGRDSISLLTAVTAPRQKRK